MTSPPRPLAGHPKRPHPPSSPVTLSRIGASVCPCSFAPLLPSPLTSRTLRFLAPGMLPR
eukprot:6207741-Pleurochrysis_carterae.AAC.3